MGSPGAGKGTQTKRISKLYNFTAISSGDALRSHIERHTPLGAQVKEVLASGGLVEDSIMDALILDSLPDRFLLDGFPRTLEQAIQLQNHILPNKLDFVINLNVPFSVLIQRVEERYIHAPTGRTYNLSFNPPKVAGLDDITGDPLVKREDDFVDVFRKRLHAYEESTLPLIEFYRKQGIVMDFKGETSDEITPQIVDSLKEFYNRKYI